MMRVGRRTEKRRTVYSPQLSRATLDGALAQERKALGEAGGAKQGASRRS